MSCSVTFHKIATKARSESSKTKQAPRLLINLKGKRAFIASVADDNG